MAMTMNQIPTPTSIIPPNCLALPVASLSEWMVCSRAVDTRTAIANINITMTALAVTKAPIAAGVPPITNACVARPARIGPVQPNPASR